MGEKSKNSSMKEKMKRRGWWEINNDTKGEQLQKSVEVAVL